MDGEKNVHSVDASLEPPRRPTAWSSGARLPDTAAYCPSGRTGKQPCRMVVGKRAVPASIWDTPSRSPARRSRFASGSRRRARQNWPWPAGCSPARCTCCRPSRSSRRWPTAPWLRTSWALSLSGRKLPRRNGSVSMYVSAIPPPPVSERGTRKNDYFPCSATTRSNLITRFFFKFHSVNNAINLLELRATVQNSSTN